MALRPTLDRSESDIEQGTAELKKKGWPESKIARWVEQKRHIVERNTRVMNQRRSDLSQHAPGDAHQWIEFIRDLISSGTAKYCALLYHHYSGGLDTEKIRLRQRLQKNVSDITPDDLLTLEEDVLFEVVAAPSHSKPRHGR